MILNTADDYQHLASRTIRKDLSTSDTISHALHGLSGEVGEIHSLYQKQYQGHNLDKQHLKSEIGDLLWFIAELCTAYSFSLSDVMVGNIQKLINRYPDGFNAEQSLHRKAGDI